MNPKTEYLAERLRHDIQSYRRQIADTEVRLLLPPADCMAPQIFEQCERERLTVLRGYLADAEGRLSRIEGQLSLSF